MTDFHMQAGIIRGFLIAKEAPPEVMEAINHVIGDRYAPPVRDKIFPKIHEDERAERDNAPAKVKKPRKPLSAEDRAKLLESLKKARQRRIDNLAVAKESAPKN